MPCFSRYGAPISAIGGLRLSIVTLSIGPSAAARTASRPSNAPVGTTIRAPVLRASLARCIRGSKAPTEAGTKIFPGFQGRQRDPFEDRRRGGLHHDVGLRQFRNIDDLRRRLKTRQIGAGFDHIAAGDRNEPQTVNASIEGTGQWQSDSTQTRDRDGLAHVLTLLADQSLPGELRDQLWSAPEPSRPVY